MQPVLQFPNKSEARRLGMEAEAMKAVFADIEAERADHDPEQIERKDAGGEATMSAARPSASQILEPCRKKVPTMAASRFIFPTVGATGVQDASGQAGSDAASAAMNRGLMA
jgi:hypothetical protein